MTQKQQAIEAIKKKLIGKTLTYTEIYAIMDELSHDDLGPVLTTYFAAAGFREGYTDEELYFLTKAMVETGPHLTFDGIVADKHSTGGIAGTRVSMILVPIIAAAGFKIPKTSSRAITSPAGTADTMEVLAPVTFDAIKMKNIVEEVGGCIIWGGPLGLAPADDVIIKVLEPLAFESYDKLIVAIMAKKIASGATHVVFDVPVGHTLKIRKIEDARIIEKKLTALANRFGITVTVDVNEMNEPASHGIGPLLEARDVISVLEQDKERPRKLENKALHLAAKLLHLCYGNKTKDEVQLIAKELLTSGKALHKFREIITAQGGDSTVSKDLLLPAKEQAQMLSSEKGIISSINNENISAICKILGAPHDKRAGIYLNYSLGDEVDRNDILYTAYASDQWKLKEVKETELYMPIYGIKENS